MDQAAEARHAQSQLQERLRRDVADMLAVLEVDLPRQFVRAVRQAFERSAEADGMSADQLKAFKAATASAAEELCAATLGALKPFEVWTWDAAWELPEDPQGLGEHPRVADALGAYGARLEALVEEHGIPASSLGDQVSYRLPSYFVAGHFMKSLVADYWRALRDHHQLSQRIREEDESGQRETRRQRWEDA